jgi:hypothetical protein
LDPRLRSDAPVTVHAWAYATVHGREDARNNCISIGTVFEVAIVQAVTLLVCSAGV